METTTNRSNLIRFGILFLLMLTFFVAVLTVKSIKEYQYVGSNPSTDRNTIVVSGEGEAFVVPDVATFSFSVIEEAKTVADAQKKATDKMNAALKAVKDLGVEDKDVRTIGYNVYPKYEYPEARVICDANGYCPPVPRKETISGYEVNQTIEVKVRDAAKAGDAISAVGSAGASNVSSINFTVDDEDKVSAEARAKAIADAKEKAGQLARELGVRLGRIVEFSESGNYPYLYKARMEMDAVMNQAGGMGSAPAAAPLPMGENKVMSNVSITYEIR